MTTVTITEAPLAVEDLLAVVDGARVELDDAIRARIAAGRAVVDRALAAGEAVYGLTTQVGHARNTRLYRERDPRRAAASWSCRTAAGRVRRCRPRSCAPPWPYG